MEYRAERMICAGVPQNHAHRIYEGDALIGTFLCGVWSPERPSRTIGVPLMRFLVSLYDQESSTEPIGDNCVM
jgi:hypothetical protein